MMRGRQMVMTRDAVKPMTAHDSYEDVCVIRRGGHDHVMERQRHTRHHTTCSAAVQHLTDSTILR